MKGYAKQIGVMVSVGLIGLAAFGASFDTVTQQDATKTGLEGFRSKVNDNFARVATNATAYIVALTNANSWPAVSNVVTVGAAAGALAVRSVDGVSNAGGDIDLVAGGIVTITPNDGANTITVTGTEVDSVYAVVSNAVEVGAALGATATQPGDDWTSTIATMSASDVTNGATLGATAIQTELDSVYAVVSNAVEVGAALGVTALQPNAFSVTNTGVTNFDITIVNGQITSFTAN